MCDFTFGCWKQVATAQLITLQQPPSPSLLEVVISKDARMSPSNLRLFSQLIIPIQLKELLKIIKTYRCAIIAHVSGQVFCLFHPANLSNNSEVSCIIWMLPINWAEIKLTWGAAWVKKIVIFWRSSHLARIKTRKTRIVIGSATFPANDSHFNEKTKY